MKFVKMASEKRYLKRLLFLGDAWINIILVGNIPLGGFLSSFTSFTDPIFILLLF